MMPWATNAELPLHIRNALPEAAQTRFRMAASKALEDGDDEKSAIRKGWALVAQGWERPTEKGKPWVRRVRAHSEPPHNPYHGEQGRLTGNPSYGVKKNAANVQGVLHIDTYLKERKKPKQEDIEKYMGSLAALGSPAPPPNNPATTRSLYVARYVQNADEIIAWAKDQGFKTTLTADDLHVTVAYSKRPVDWMKVGQDSPWANEKGDIYVNPGGPRIVAPLGDKGAIVLLFSSQQLNWRHDQIMRDGNASWDFQGYQPHVTITWDKGDLDLSTIEPYNGKIVLGPEIFAEVNDNWSDNITEKAYAELMKAFGEPPQEEYRIAKVDSKLGLVFGWAIVCKVNGEDYYDLNIDKQTKERVPEHIPEDTMLKCAADFMENSRVQKIMHNGEQVGNYVFAFPLTTDIAKAMGIETKVTGLMVAAKPSPEHLKRFESGELKGFSIGGSATKVEDFH